jgi:murein DD-endopeptidase MepM/ murein hydrolase activator NlpD
MGSARCCGYPPSTTRCVERGGRVKKAVIAAVVAAAIFPMLAVLSLTVLLNPATTNQGVCVAATTAPGAIPETGRLVFPLPAGTYLQTSRFGVRSDPFTGEPTLHAGNDWAAGDGTPILAFADGVVTYAGMSGGVQGRIVIEHTIDGGPVATVYLHMWAHGIYVSPGQWVVAGQVIGAVGSSGRSTGPHLHFEIHPGGASAAAVDPLVWMAGHTVDGALAPGTGLDPCG